MCLDDVARRRTHVVPRAHALTHPSFTQVVGVSTSCGIGPNKLLARLASTCPNVKPNGQAVVLPDGGDIDAVRLSRASLCKPVCLCVCVCMYVCIHFAIDAKRPGQTVAILCASFLCGAIYAHSLRNYLYG